MTLAEYDFNVFPYHCGQCHWDVMITIAKMSAHWKECVRVR